MFNTSSYADNPWRIALSLIGVAIIIALIVFLNVSKTIKSNKAFSSGEIALKKINPEEEAFYKLAGIYQLKKDEIRFLLDVLRSGRGEPAEILADNTALDAVFKTYYKQMRKEAERSASSLKYLVKLFEIRNCIAYFQNTEVINGHTVRQYIRKEVNLPGACCLVDEVKAQKGGKTIKRLVLSKNVFNGTVMDLSAGGCAFTASANIKAGARLKIEMSIDKDRKISALAEIIRINKKANAAIFHTCFLKVMPKSMCVINAYIFGYDTK
jgi:hypothetical protein